MSFTDGQTTIGRGRQIKAIDLCPALLSQDQYVLTWDNPSNSWTLKTVPAPSTVPASSITGGANGQFIRWVSGVSSWYTLLQSDILTLLGGLTLSQILTLLQAPGNTTTYLRGDGNFSSLGGNYKNIICASQTAGNMSSIATTAYLPIQGFLQLSISAENYVQTVMPFGGTFKNAFVFVAGNASTTSTVFILRKNSVNTGIVVTVAAGSIGTFFDVTHSVTFVQGDIFDWAVSQSVTSALVGGSISMELDPS